MTEFTLRIFLTDYYLSKPIPYIDDVFNDFTSKEISQVPIIRVFGTTPKGQKVCAHIHGVYPYFYVPFMDDYSILNDQSRMDSFLLQFSSYLNDSIKNSLNYISSSAQYVHKVVLVKGKQFYGYQDDFQYFLKIYLYNPTMIKKTAELLESGAVMNKIMQPFETHISYNLKFFIDYNLYGMNFLFTDAAKFRIDKDHLEYSQYCDFTSQMFVGVSQRVWNNADILHGEFMLDPVSCPKMTSCELEVDISACDILNYLEIDENIGQNPGLKNLWDEEKQRRIDLGLNIKDLVGEPFEERPLAKCTKSESTLIEKWNTIVNSTRAREGTHWINEDIENFLHGSQSDDDVESMEDILQALDISMSQDLSTEIVNPQNCLSEASANKVCLNEWDDDMVIEDFVNQCMKQEEEELSVLRRTKQADTKNYLNSSFKSPVQNEPHSSPEGAIDYIELDSDSESDNLFNKTFIDLSLEDSSDSESSDKLDIIHRQTNGDIIPQKANSSCEDLFDNEVFSVSSESDGKDIAILQYDGADDIIGVEDVPRKIVDRSPIVTRSRSRINPDGEVSLIALIERKIQKRKENKIKRPRISLKLKKRDNTVLENTVTEDKPSEIPAKSSVVPVEINIISEAPEIKNEETACFVYSSPPPRKISRKNSSLFGSNDIDEIYSSFAPSSKPLFSTPVQSKVKPMNSSFMEISPISNLFKTRKTPKSKRKLSFSIPEVSFESPNTSPNKVNGINETMQVSRSDKLKLLNDMKQSASQSFYHADNSTGIFNSRLIETCHLTILSGEIFCNSQSNLKPNPRFDQILMFFYAVHDETDLPDNSQLENSRINHGIIYVDDGMDIMKRTGVTFSANQHPIPVSNETELLDKIIELVWEFDPDILVGYEVTRSSWGYVFERSLHLKHKLFKGLSRLLSEPKSFGNMYNDYHNEFKLSELHCEGRIILNLWIVLKYELTLTSYTVESCVHELLKERVPNYTNQQLLTWNQSNLERHHVVRYFTYRALANIRLLSKMNFISRISEFAKIFGIEFYHVFSRGSQYRVESMMLRLAKPQNLIAISPNVRQRARQKAPECIPLTLEPRSGFYTDPVVVLDFQSLYPSIMIAYNYCYATTLGKMSHFTAVQPMEPYELGCNNMTLKENTIHKLGSDVTISPNGVVFVRPQVKKGIISKMVEEILNTRIMIKKSMKIHANNTALCKLLDSRQLGLKLIANVTFGYTAASYSGRMPCVEVGDSIVRKSRETLEETIKLINSGGPRGKSRPDSEGGWAGCSVIYGDTDSVFVLMPNRTKDEAFQLGAKIVDAVNELNPFPVKLKFEKVYLPCLLEAKKKYVGFSYEFPEQVEPKFEAKGIETVRRDNCGIASKILERTLKCLFTSCDVDLVKRYVCQQLEKVMRGDINLIDFIIAKEYRGRDGYSAGATIPSCHIARELSKKDPRAEPLSGERVPYVIVQGAPNDTLISCVRRPEEIIFNTRRLRAYGNNIRVGGEQGCRLSYTYYITKQILPPLNRALTLLGVDVFKWYSQMPKRLQGSANGFRAMPSTNRKGNTMNRTISSYFKSSSCLLCRATVKAIGKAPLNSLATVLCDNCLRAGSQSVYLSIIHQKNAIEHRRVNLLEQCYTCTGVVASYTGVGPPCVSTDCKIFFDRIRACQQSTENLDRLLNSELF